MKRGRHMHRVYEVRIIKGCLKNGQSSVEQKCPQKIPINIRKSIQVVTVNERIGGYRNVTNMGPQCNLDRTSDLTLTFEFNNIFGILVLLQSYFTTKYQFSFSRQIMKKGKNFQEQKTEHDPKHDCVLMQRKEGRKGRKLSTVRAPIKHGSANSRTYNQKSCERARSGA